MKNGIHSHNCHICGKDFECKKQYFLLSECPIEDRYAVCYSQECIKEFEEELNHESQIVR